MSEQDQTNQGNGQKPQAGANTNPPAPPKADDQIKALRAAESMDQVEAIRQAEESLENPRQSVLKEIDKAEKRLSGDDDKPESAKAQRGEIPDFMKPDYRGPLDTRQAKRRLKFRQSPEGKKLYEAHEKAAK